MHRIDIIIYAYLLYMKGVWKQFYE